MIEINCRPASDRDFNAPAAPSRRRRTNSGFTILEVVAVLVIVGILAAVAITRAMDNSYDVHQAAEALKVHLRQAHFRAMHSDTTWGIHATGSSYWLFSGNNLNNKSIFLGQNSDTVSLPAGVSCGTFTIAFDDWGRPYGGADPETAPLLQTNQSITVSSGSTQVNVTITKNTGFIP